jgi:pimeloyl-ACP methyl ester carboxylesterase
MFHPPANEGMGGPGAVLCYPMGWEYLRSHRCMKILAETFATQGIATLRFDYSGCGDSSGDFVKYGEINWIEDILNAIKVLKTGAPVTEISVVGLRSGAWLGYQAAMEGINLDALVLWEPTTSVREPFPNVDRKDSIFQGKDSSALKAGGLEMLRFLEHWQARKMKVKRALIVGEGIGVHDVGIGFEGGPGVGCTFMETSDSNFWEHPGKKRNQLIPDKTIRLITGWMANLKV